jgi:hypothetical protein
MKAACSPPSSVGPTRGPRSAGRSGAEGAGGSEPVTLADSRTIDPEDVLGPPERRMKLVIVGDTETTEGLAEHVREADVPVIEGTAEDIFEAVQEVLDV